MLLLAFLKFIHIVEYNSTPFFFKAICQSSADSYLECFQFGLLWCCYEYMCLAFVVSIQHYRNCVSRGKSAGTQDNYLKLEVLKFFQSVSLLYVCMYE